MSASDRVDPHRLESLLARQCEFAIDRIEVFDRLESTNRYLLEHAPDTDQSLRVCVAEEQTGGRGRRGRAWHSPRSSGLYLSVGWRYAGSPSRLTALTLAAGVIIRRALGELFGIDIRLKWPNDVVWDQRKLGGVLVELAAGAPRGCCVVVGIGINVALPDETLAAISDWPRGAVDLRSAVGRADCDRTALAWALCLGIGRLLAAYADEGFSAYRTEWCSADHLRGTQIKVQGSGADLLGTAAGIDADGALIVLDGTGRMHRVIAGDVSVRAT